MRAAQYAQVKTVSYQQAHITNPHSDYTLLLQVKTTKTALKLYVLKSQALFSCTDKLW